MRQDSSPPPSQDHEALEKQSASTQPLDGASKGRSQRRSCCTVQEDSCNPAGSCEVSAGAQEIRDMLKVILRPSGPHSQGYIAPPAHPLISAASSPSLSCSHYYLGELTRPLTHRSKPNVEVTSLITGSKSCPAPQSPPRTQGSGEDRENP